MKLIKVIKKNTYVGKNGNTYNYKNYYIELDNGRYIAIRPTFKDDYKTLEIVSITVNE